MMATQSWRLAGKNVRKHRWRLMGGKEEKVDGGKCRKILRWRGRHIGPARQDEASSVELLGAGAVQGLLKFSEVPNLFLSETKLDEKRVTRFKHLLDLGHMVVLDAEGRSMW
jgi:hypothetical protein